MGYSDFKSLTQVCEEFPHLNVEKKEFIKEENFVIKESEKCVYEFIMKKFENPFSFVNEVTICEKIISPILDLVAEENNLPVWSQASLIVEKERNLSGAPDFLLAPANKGMDGYSKPVVCLVEAKDDKFKDAWGQLGAEMLASQMLNNNKEIPVWGITSNGSSWQFGKLIGDLFTINTISYGTPIGIEKVLNILNWIFKDARKNADTLLALDKEGK